MLLAELDDVEARLTPVSGVLPDGRLHLMTALTLDNDAVYPPFRVPRR